MTRDVATSHALEVARWARRSRSAGATVWNGRVLTVDDDMHQASVLLQGFTEESPVALLDGATFEPGQQVQVMYPLDSPPYIVGSVPGTGSGSDPGDDGDTHSHRVVFDPYDYGAIGTNDPRNDDTQAFVECFDAAAAASDVGAKVWVHDGVFYVDPEQIVFRNLCTYDFESAWLVRRKGTPGQYGLRTEGFDTGDVAYGITIRGLIYDGNYIKYEDGTAEIENPDADPPGGHGGDGLSFYGESCVLEEIRIKNCKGVGAWLLGPGVFGAGLLNTGQHVHVKGLHVVNCYGDWGIVAAILDGFLHDINVAQWDTDHPISHSVLGITGQVGIVLGADLGFGPGGGGMKWVKGHVWGEGLGIAAYDFVGRNFVSTVTLESAGVHNLWLYGSFSEWDCIDIYDNTADHSDKQGVVFGSSIGLHEAWGDVFRGQVYRCHGGAVVYQRAFNGNRVEATVWQDDVAAITELGDPDNAPTGDGSNVVDIIVVDGS